MEKSELSLKEYYKKYFPFDVVIYFICCGRVSAFSQIEKSFGWEPIDSENESVYELFVCKENMKYCGICEGDMSTAILFEETECQRKVNRAVSCEDFLENSKEEGHRDKHNIESTSGALDTNTEPRKTEELSEERHSTKHIWRHMFCSADYFHTSVLKHIPHRIDIGGMYPILSQNEDEFADHKRKLKTIKTKMAGATCRRALIFDIDLSDDINEYRNCECCNKQVCDECWSLVRDAIVFIQDILKSVFGYKLVYVFASGGRGAHIWVQDPEACILTKNERQVIVDYMFSHSRAPKFLSLLLDANLTYSMNHLCRCPFSVHNRSGNICCPINDIQTFLPSHIPCIKNPCSVLNFFNPTDDTSSFFSFCKSIGFQNIE